MNLEQAVTIVTIAFLQTHAITICIIYHLSLEGFIMSFQFHTKRRGTRRGSSLTLDLAWKATAREPERRAACGELYVRKAQKSHTLW